MDSAQLDSNASQLQITRLYVGMLILLSSADAVFTDVAVRAGLAYEANTAVRWLMEIFPGAWIPIKIGLTVLCGGLVYLGVRTVSQVSERTAKFYNRALLLVVVLYGILDIYHAISLTVLS